MKTTIGSIVHYYDTSLPDGVNNGAGKGPYAAVVIQNFDSGDYVNLKVLAWGSPFDAGSVLEKHDGQTEGRYFIWPHKAGDAS